MSSSGETAAPPRSFLEALKSRYGAEDDIDSYDPSAFLVGDKGRKRNKTWQLVGMEKTRAKQSRYDRLVDVVLKSQGITVAVKESEKRQDTAVREGEQAVFKDDLAAQRMVSLKELDLSDNANLPLGEIAKLISYFPRLDTLQLSDMPALLPSFGSIAAASLPSPSPSAEASDKAEQQASSAVLSSEGLRKLVLNNAGFASMVQLRLLLHLPSLEELHLDANGIRDLVIAASPAEEALLAARGGEEWLRMPTVHTLSLAHNCIQSWEKLGETLPKVFPGLQKLFLTNNMLPNLVLQDGPTPSPYGFLRPLSLLCLNENSNITDTRTVDAMRVLCPALEVFRITYSALLPRWNDSLSRMFVIASMPTIKLLNRGQVRPKERLDSEIFYIQRGLAEREALEKAREEGGEAAVANAKAQFEGEPAYPLLDSLREKHHDLVLSIYKAGATASSDGSSHLMLDVRLRCENNYKPVVDGAPAGAVGANPFNELCKTLPSSLTVAKLKALVKVAFQVDPPNQQISYRTGDDGVLERPVEMDNELQTLGYYGVCNGAIITVRDTSLR